MRDNCWDTLLQSESALHCYHVLLYSACIVPLIRVEYSVSVYQSLDNIGSFLSGSLRLNSDSLNLYFTGNIFIIDF